MASAEEASISNLSSLRRPSSPVELSPTARLQNQHVWSFSLCWPMIVMTRCMWLIFVSNSSIADAKFAVSSNMARTSVIDGPSTSSNCLSIWILWIPASTPRKTGTAGDPFSVSSAAVNIWHNMSAMPPDMVADLMNATNAVEKTAMVPMKTVSTAKPFWQAFAWRGLFRSAQRQHRRQQRQAATQQQTCQIPMQKMPVINGTPKSTNPEP
mmetsp:Transcript_53308/g.114520  ORF Transcript_53308/g.114520 Transcript_53308/m.114520 type:complete len:211 (+) Transcript_53308:1602-2234(+)